MKRVATVPIVALLLATVLLTAGALGVVDDSRRPTETVSSGIAAPIATQSLDGAVRGLQARARRVPRDHVAWASLGLAYVQQAKVTANPVYYPKAEKVLRRSLRLNRTDNFVAHAGMAALAAARHEFAEAKRWAEQGLAINPANAALHGSLADALVQLGDYPAAFAAIQRMVDLVPDTASLARASYAWELRGRVDLAEELMERALRDAGTGSDRAFARYYLGELAFDNGDPDRALAHYEAGLEADPSYAINLQGRAKARAALGHVDQALADYADVVARVPEPAHVLEYGELLESLGRRADAQSQYELFQTVEKLYESNGVLGDVDLILFHADHGDPQRAVQYGEAAVASRPFLAVQDAYAWALHKAGRHHEAFEWSSKARSLGLRSALFSYHAAMIEEALGRHHEAQASLRAALEINPHFHPLWAPEARRMLAAPGRR